MNEPTKTATFVATAAVMVGLAVTSYFFNRPKTASDFELVGLPFYEKFTSSEQAQSLEVSALDPDSLALQQFSVKYENGLWRIPSHHNYPAEAAARLAETAASVMGIERESLAGRLASEHEKLGVVDPLSTADELLEDPAAAGKRITLKDKSGDVLIDYIIGKEAGDVSMSEAEQTITAGRKPEKFYYVRRPDEQQTYKVRLNVNLSTKFSEWIDPDLLQIDPNQLVELEIDNYQLTEDQSNPLSPVKALQKDQGDQMTLTRESNTDPWQLSDLNVQTEELDKARISQIVNVLDEIRIVDVRPKLKYKDHLLLTPELTLNAQPEFNENPQEFGSAIQRLQNELENRGFSLAGTAEKLELVSTHGEVELGSNEGLRYMLQIGKEVEGEDKAIEIGDEPTNSEQEESGESSDAAGGSESDAPTETATPADDDVVEKNRYLMIRVSFDESLLGEKPTPPAEPQSPEKPAGYLPPADDAIEEASTESGAAESDGGQDVDAVEKDQVTADDGQSTEQEPSAEDESPDRDPAFVAYDDAMADFEQAKVDYELELSRYASDLEAFDKRIAEGKKRVDELNQRFGDWYYVISGSNLKTLQTTREELVTIKEIPAEGNPSDLQGINEQESALPAPPDITFPETSEIE